MITRQSEQLSEEQVLQLAAVQAFLWRCTVPVMVESVPNRPIPCGTGTLFRVNNRHFIVTARHVFETDKEALTHLALPVAREGGDFIRLLKVTYTVPKHEFIDVAVLEIVDPESLSEVLKHWDFLTLENVKITPPTSKVWITGYPYDDDWQRQERTLIIKPVTILTDLLPQVPSEADQPVYAGLDLFFLYERYARVLGKDIHPTPELPGVSGASFWELVGQPPKGEAWLPERFVKAVAVQSAYKHSYYMRAMSWFAVAKLIAKIDEELREAIHSETGVTLDNSPTS